MNRARPLLHSSWTWLAIGLVLVGLISLVGAGGSAPPALDAGSARPNGALALRLWLGRLGYPVTVSFAAPRPGTLAGSATVALMRAGSDVAGGDMPGLLSWVRAGGRLVVVTDGSTGGAVLDRLGVLVEPVFPERMVVNQPLLLAPPVASLSGSASAVMQGTDRDVEVASASGGSVLLRRAVGRGSIWILSAPALLENAHIAAGENRRLALNLAGPRGTPVLFDQYRAPALGGSNGNWLTSTAWGVALLFLIAVLVLYRWLAGTRLGPAVTPLRLQYRPATEYVVSLAALLRRGRRREDVLRIYQESLQRLLRRRYGGVENAPLARDSREEVEALLRPSPALSESELLQRAAAIVREAESLES